MFTSYIFSCFLFYLTKSSKKLGIPDSLTSMEKDYQNISISRVIKVSDVFEDQEIIYRVKKHTKASKNHPYLIFVPQNKIGHLTNISAAYSVLSSKKTQLNIRSSIHDNVKIGSTNFFVFEVSIPWAKVSLLNSSDNFCDLRVSLTYTKPFEIDPFGVEYKEGKMNLLYREFVCVFSIYHTSTMQTTLTYSESSSHLSHYNSYEGADLPVLLKEDSKMIEIGPFKDIVPSSSGQGCMDEIKGIFRTKKGFLEFEHLQREIYLPLVGKQTVVSDEIVSRNLFRRAYVQKEELIGSSVENNIRALRLFPVLGDASKVKKVFKREKKVARYFWSKDERLVFVKFNKALEPGQTKVIKYNFILEEPRSKELELCPISEDSYFSNCKTLLVAPLFKKFKRVESVHSYRLVSITRNFIRRNAVEFIRTNVDPRSPQALLENFELEWDKIAILKIIGALIFARMGLFLILRFRRRQTK